MRTQGNCWRSLAARGAALAALVLLPALARAEYQGKVQILLLGDSATEASIPRKIAPDEAQFEDVIHILLAAEEKLTCFEFYPRYAAEQAEGPNMLNYRRFPLAKIPAKFHELAKPYVVEQKGRDPYVVVLDNRLDAHFGSLGGWFGDRHPNLAGYRLIADETVKFLAPIMRARSRK